MIKNKENFAVGYCRVSTDKQREESLDHQQREIQKYADLSAQHGGASVLSVSDPLLDRYCRSVSDYPGRCAGSGELEGIPAQEMAFCRCGSLSGCGGSSGLGGAVGEKHHDAGRPGSDLEGGLAGDSRSSGGLGHAVWHIYDSDGDRTAGE